MDDGSDLRIIPRSFVILSFDIRHFPIPLFLVYNGNSSHPLKK